jgi:ornithine cyclodeaminase/alanine dehydrogenase-like protein (mu-crystallin family)
MLWDHSASRQQTDVVSRLLRLPNEPCVHYPEQTVHAALMDSLCPFMDALERFYRAWSEDESAVRQPPKHVFQRTGVRGDWRVMPCAIDRVWPAADGADAGIDAVKVIGTNEEERVVADKISVGKALLLHPTDHFVEAIFDVAALSSFRTAAISVLAYKYCGHRRDHSAGIVGAGRVGFYTAVILREWLGIEHLVVHDLDERRGEDFLAALAGWYGGRVRIAILDSVRRDSQALFLATTSQQPLIDGRLDHHMPFIASVGADADNLSELNADVLDGRMLLSESQQNIAFGDLKRWHEAGLIRPADLIMLPHLLAAAARGTPVTTPAVFISTGAAVQDALVCRFLHDRLGGRGGLPLATAPHRG